jgi:cobalamin synthase
MEHDPLPKIPPSELRSQMRFVGLIGLAMDVLVAAVILAFQPFEQNIRYVLVAALVAAGTVLTYVFAVVFPKKYERYYNRLQGKDF